MRTFEYSAGEERPVCLIRNKDDINTTVADTNDTEHVTTVSESADDGIPEDIVDENVGVEVVTRKHGSCGGMIGDPVNGTVSTPKKKKKIINEKDLVMA